MTIVEWNGKKGRPSSRRVYAGEAAASGGEAAREQYRRQQAARRVGFAARISRLRNAPCSIRGTAGGERVRAGGRETDNES